MRDRWRGAAHSRHPAPNLAVGSYAGEPTE
jgi:hypothetical protein